MTMNNIFIDLIRYRSSYIHHLHTCIRESKNITMFVYLMLSGGKPFVYLMLSHGKPFVYLMLNHGKLFVYLMLSGGKPIVYLMLSGGKRLFI